MNINRNFKKIFFIIILKLILTNPVYSTTDETFDEWLLTYKKYALKNGISKDTIDKAFNNVVFLEKVIQYDRKQPEFYEDTLTYVKKRANNLRVKKGKKLLEQNRSLLQEIESNFFVEKEILLSLWGIETNFGKHVGKMDIISCLATLSYDKRRRDFFSSELLILLQLLDDKLINQETLYGSWAGAFGNFQFMPSSIKTYAIDYDKDDKIDLKNSFMDSLASAANYIHKIGWKMNQPCFYRVKLTSEINKRYINKSARKIKNKLKVKKWLKKGVVLIDKENINNDLLAGLIQPDGKMDSPAYIVFENYEKILKWNRSLRFGISVCTLANKIKA